MLSGVRGECPVAATNTFGHPGSGSMAGYVVKRAAAASERLDATSLPRILYPGNPSPEHPCHNTALSGEGATRGIRLTCANTGFVPRPPHP